MGAEAAVNTGGVRNVAVLGTRQVGEQRAGEGGWGNICAGPTERPHVAFLHWDTIYLGVADRPAWSAHWNRTLEPHDLLDRRRQQIGIGDDPTTLLGVGSKPGEDARQRRRNGVEAGDGEHMHDV